MLSGVVQQIRASGHGDELTLLGAAVLMYVVIKLTLSIIRAIRTFLIAPRVKLALDLKSIGSWAGQDTHFLVSKMMMTFCLLNNDLQNNKM